MIKKILGALCSAALFSCSFAWADSRELGTSVSLDYILEQGIPQTIDNKVFFPIKAICVTETTDLTDNLRVTILKKTAKVNGELLQTGDERTLVIENASVLTIDADKGASAQLLNEGEHPIKAHCTMRP